MIRERKITRIAKALHFAVAITLIWLSAIVVYADQWLITYNISVDEVSPISVQQTPDGGYIAAMSAHLYGSSNSDVLVMKLNGSGAIDWQKNYGSSRSDFVHTILPTRDDGYIVTAEQGHKGRVLIY